MYVPTIYFIHGYICVLENDPVAHNDCQPSSTYTLYQLYIYIHVYIGTITIYTHSHTYTYIYRQYNEDVYLHIYYNLKTDYSSILVVIYIGRWWSAEDRLQKQRALQQWLNAYFSDIMKPVNRTAYARGSYPSYIYIHIIMHIYIFYYTKYSRARRDWKLLGWCPLRILLYINSAHCARQPRLRRNTHHIIYTAAAYIVGPALRWEWVGWGCSHYIRLVIVENVYIIIYRVVRILYIYIILYLYVYRRIIIICTLRLSTMHAQWRDDYIAHIHKYSDMYVPWCIWLPIYIYLYRSHNALMATRPWSAGERGSEGERLYICVCVCVLCRYYDIIYLAIAKGLEHNTTRHAQVHWHAHHTHLTSSDPLWK